MTLSANDFLDVLEEDKRIDRTIRFGKVDPAYTAGRPKIIFDGTTTVSVKQFPYLGSYIPSANDRVMIIKNVVIDKIL